MGTSNSFFSLFVITGFLAGFTNGILIRNPITDRCIHIGKKEGQVAVYADPCTFINPKTKEEGNRDQLLEVVRLSPVPGTLEHIVQKDLNLNDKLTCLQIQKESVQVSDCKSASAIFLFKKVLTGFEGRASYESKFPGAIYTIEEPESGNCLTVVPGSSELGLVNCSEKNAFQRWVTCRHIQACDVELTWSAESIIFPHDTHFLNNNKSSQINLSPPQKKVENNENMRVTVEVSPNNKKKPTTIVNNVPTVIINDPLYFVYNALKMRKLKENEIEKIIREFYSIKEISKALEILEEKFSLYIDPRSRVVSSSLKLVNQMKVIIQHGLNSSVVFASEDLSKVPALHSKISDEKSLILELEKLENLKVFVQSNVASVVDDLERIKSKVLSDIEEITLKNNGTEVEEEEESFIDLINPRIEKPKRIRNRFRS